MQLGHSLVWPLKTSARQRHYRTRCVRIYRGLHQTHVTPPTSALWRAAHIGKQRAVAGASAIGEKVTSKRSKRATCRSYYCYCTDLLLHCLLLHYKSVMFGFLSALVSLLSNRVDLLSNRVDLLSNRVGLLYMLYSWYLCLLISTLSSCDGHISYIKCDSKVYITTGSRHQQQLRGRLPPH